MLLGMSFILHKFIFVFYDSFVTYGSPVLHVLYTLLMCIHNKTE